MNEGMKFLFYFVAYCIISCIVGLLLWLIDSNYRKKERKKYEYKRG